MRQKKQRMNQKLKMALTFLLVLCTASGVAALFTPLFHVSEVLCEGISRVTAEEVLSAAGEVRGKNIFTLRLSGIDKRVEEIPMVEKASVKRVFPDKIKVIVEECVPAGYLLSGNQCVVTDIDGKILEIVADERVNVMIETFTPKKKEPEQTPEPKSEKEKESGEPNPSPTPKPTPSPTPTPQPEGTVFGEPPGLREYSVPLVLGLEPEKPAVGKKVECKDKELLNRVFSIFRNLEKAGLLSRATYLDLRDWQDVVLVIENRLEIQLGVPDNMEYRSAFLATVINEKMSATEHAIMDYRKPDIYVRQPEDGKERVKPTPTPKPTPSPSPKPKKEIEDAETAPEPTEQREEASVMHMED